VEIIQQKQYLRKAGFLKWGRIRTAFPLVLNLKTEYTYDYELKAILIRKDFAVENHSNLG
jgi:hypothetical protein